MDVHQSVTREGVDSERVSLRVSGCRLVLAVHVVPLARVVAQSRRGVVVVVSGVVVVVVSGVVVAVESVGAELESVEPNSPPAAWWPSEVVVVVVVDVSRTQV